MNTVRSTRWRAMAAAALVIIPAGLQAQTAPEPAEPIVVELEVPTTEAFDRVVAAFEAVGLTVHDASRSEGTVKSAGVVRGAVTTGQMTQVSVTPAHFYLARVSPRDGGSTVTLSVTSRAYTRLLTNSGFTPEAPLYECDNQARLYGPSAYQSCIEAKARAEGLARRIARLLRAR